MELANSNRRRKNRAARQLSVLLGLKVAQDGLAGHRGQGYAPCAQESHIRPDLIAVTAAGAGREASLNP